MITKRGHVLKMEDTVYDNPSHTSFTDISGGWVYALSNNKNSITQHFRIP